MASSSENRSASRQTTTSLACLGCRRSKVRCDRQTPSCGRCQKSKSECSYPTERRLGGRLKYSTGIRLQTTSDDVPKDIGDMHSSGQASDIAAQDSNVNQAVPPSQEDYLDCGLSKDDAQHLTDVYFETVHGVCPILHRTKYLESLPLPSPLKTATCLQYIIMALAATHSEHHMQMSHPLYRRARLLADTGESTNALVGGPTILHAQAWLLIAMFEGQQGVFSRASISFSYSVRAAQSCQLHKLPGNDHYLQESMPPEWWEIEEQRRTWWALFNTDRLLSATTGWPSLIDMNDVCTPLPASDNSFANGQPEPCRTLHSLLGDFDLPASNFVRNIVAAHLFHEIVLLGSSTFSDAELCDTDNGGYWKQHRRLDDHLTILRTSISSTAPHLNYRNPHEASVHLVVQAATIRLHQSAIQRLQPLDASNMLMDQSEDRAFLAAEEIVHIMKATSNAQLIMRNPIALFSMASALLVMIGRLDSDDGSHHEDNLVFLLNMLAIAGRGNPVARSLAEQLVARAKSPETDQGKNHQSYNLAMSSAGPLLSFTSSDACDTSFRLPSPPTHEV
ncbi:fungal-specific transcription factor domain-containing protein [Pestalotiopsis sp. NC0098]|nr:fungal-specific transcription factor domain-containing protein [Pestalotiopsis sp. NC0098]